MTISLSPSYVTIFLELYWLHKCNRIHHIRHISIQITIKLSWLSKSFLSLYLTFIFFHCMSAHQHLRHFYEYLWRLELEFRIEKTVSQRDSSIHPLSNPPLSAQIRNCICHLGLVQGGVSRTLEFSFFSHKHVIENHHMTWQYHVISVYDPYDRRHVMKYHVSVSSPFFWAVLIL